MSEKRGFVVHGREFWWTKEEMIEELGVPPEDVEAIWETGKRSEMGLRPEIVAGVKTRCLENLKKNILPENIVLRFSDRVIEISFYPPEGVMFTRVDTVDWAGKHHHFSSRWDKINRKNIETVIRQVEMAERVECKFPEKKKHWLFRDLPGKRRVKGTLEPWMEAARVKSLDKFMGEPGSNPGESREEREREKEFFVKTLAERLLYPYLKAEAERHGFKSIEAWERWKERVEREKNNFKGFYVGEWDQNNIEKAVREAIENPEVMPEGCPDPIAFALMEYGYDFSKVRHHRGYAPVTFGGETLFYMYSPHPRTVKEAYALPYEERYFPSGNYIVDREIVKAILLRKGWSFGAKGWQPSAS